MVTFIQTKIIQCSCSVAFCLFKLLYRYFNSRLSLPIYAAEEQQMASR